MDKGPSVAVIGELNRQKRSEKPNTSGLSRKRPSGVPNVNFFCSALASRRTAGKFTRR